MDAVKAAAGRNELCNGLGHRVDGAVVRAPAGQIWIKAKGHHADGACRAAKDRQLCRHRLGFGQLILSAIGHLLGCRTDGGVKALHKALLGADVQVGEGIRKGLGKALSRRKILCGLCSGDLLEVVVLLLRRLDLDLCLLVCAVRVQERAGDVDDRPAAPVENKAGLLCHHSDRGCLKVLLRRIAQERLLILRVDDDCHSLLGLGDGKLRAVETLVLLRHEVEVDLKAVGELADGDRDAAGAEVIALLDDVGDLGPPKEPLQLSLGRGIALLDLGAAGGEGLLRVGLGGAGCAAHAVTPGSSAEEDDHIARGRVLPDHVLPCRSAHDGTDLHALCHISRMVELRDLTGRKADLVAVAGVALGSARHELLLGKLSLKGLGDRSCRIRSARHAHGLVYIASSGERVADGTAKAGGSAAEGLNLRRVVVGLILEEEEPLLSHRSLAVVHLNGDDNRAGVVLIGLLLVGELAFRLEFPGTDERKVHEAGILVRAILKELCPAVLVALEGGLHRYFIIPVIKGDICDLCREGRVAAVIGPVGVEHTDLGHCGIAVLLVFEVVLDELEVAERHRKAKGIVEVLEVLFRHPGKSRKDPDVRCLGIVHLQGIRDLHRGLSRVDGVDDILLDPCKLLVRDRTLEDVDLCRADRDIGVGVQELNALDCGVRTLIKLSGKGLDGEHPAPLWDGNAVPAEHVDRGLGEDAAAGSLKDVVADVLTVIPDEKPQGCDALHAEECPDLLQALARLDRIGGLFLNIDSSDLTAHSVSFCDAKMNCGVVLFMYRYGFLSKAVPCEICRRCSR